MIDTLMMAYTVEMVSVERVLTCIQKFTPFIPEEDFPYDSEEAIITWVNKVRFLQLITCDKLYQRFQPDWSWQEPFVSFDIGSQLGRIRAKNIFSRKHFIGQNKWISIFSPLPKEKDCTWPCAYVWQGFKKIKLCHHLFPLLSF